jgi:hypothetical protein
MRVRSASTLVILSLILPLPVPAIAVQNDSQVWTTAAVNVKLSDKWRLSNELTGRFSDNRNGLYDLEDDLLSAISYKKVRRPAMCTIPIFRGRLHHHGTRFREQATFAKVARIAAVRLTHGSGSSSVADGKDGTGWLSTFVK